MGTYVCELCEDVHEVGDPDPHGFGDGGDQGGVEIPWILAVPLWIVGAPVLLLMTALGILEDR